MFLINPMRFTTKVSFIVLGMMLSMAMLAKGADPPVKAQHDVLFKNSSAVAVNPLALPAFDNLYSVTGRFVDVRDVKVAKVSPVAVYHVTTYGILPVIASHRLQIRQSGQSGYNDSKYYKTIAIKQPVNQTVRVTTRL